VTFEDIGIWSEVAWRFGRREALKYPPSRRFPAEMMHPAGLVLPHLSGAQDARDAIIMSAATEANLNYRCCETMPFGPWHDRLVIGPYSPGVLYRAGKTHLAGCCCKVCLAT